MADDDALLDALAQIRERGAIGEASLLDAVAHADHFVALIPPGTERLADLGAGGGLPGLVIAWRRPEIRTVLIERRSTRADLLRRAVSALGLGGSVEIVGADVRAVAIDRGRVFDVVTARSFAAPAITAAHAASLLRPPTGIALISDPPLPDPERWSPAVLVPFGLVDDGLRGGIRRLRCR